MARATFPPADFIAKLRAGDFATDPLSVTGVVKPSEEADGLLFSPGRDCKNWVSVPIKLIDRVETLQIVRCGDHRYPLVNLTFQVPTTEEAGTFAAISALITEPAFLQTFATTVYPNGQEFSGLSIVWIPADIDDVGHFSITAEMADTPRPRSAHARQTYFDNILEFENDDTFEARDFSVNSAIDVIFLLSRHLKAGIIGQLSEPHYLNIASAILEAAELPVRSSPLQGTTLASLIGASGSVAVLQIFHNGVSPAEAVVSVLFLAGAMIVLGTANAVRRALEAGLERKLLHAFGIPTAEQPSALKGEQVVVKKKKSPRPQKL